MLYSMLTACECSSKEKEQEELKKYTNYDLVEVSCEFKISKKCKNRYFITKRNYVQNLSRNDGKNICLYCSRSSKFSGRNNPNCKYQVNDNFFSLIDTKKKAWILGWIASDGHISNKGFCIKIHKKDKDVLEKIRDILCKELPISKDKNHRVILEVNSQKISADLKVLLGLKSEATNKKSSIVKFPNLKDEMKIPFIRGFFEGDGWVSATTTKKRFPRCGIASNSSDMLKEIQSIVAVPCCVGKTSLEWSRNNALDFLSLVYENTSYPHLNRKKRLFRSWSTWQPSLNRWNRVEKFKWIKIDKNAFSPSKVRASDSGFDLTVIGIKEKVGNVLLCHTGIRVEPAFGYYFDMVPRSSMIKTGHMLANSVGVIDRAYVGEILVPIIKIDDNMPDLIFPNRLVQLIPRHIINPIFEEEQEINNTDRGSGGFGSTDKE